MNSDVICGVAALELRRNFLGIDTSEEYAELSRRHIAEARASLPLFTLEAAQ